VGGLGYTGKIALYALKQDFESDNPRTVRQFKSEILRESLKDMLDDLLLNPGPYRKESIPASGEIVSKSEREIIQVLGNKYGCHSCGTKVSPGGYWVGDHQRPTKLIKHDVLMGETVQDLYPQCTTCSASQGGKVSAILRLWIGKG